VSTVPRHARALRLLGLPALPFVLVSCMGGAAPPPTFDLGAPQEFGATRRAGRGQVVVAEPTALSTLNSDRIVVRAGGAEVSYLPHAQWSDRLPRLLQSRIVEAFGNANRLQAVGTPDDRLAADYQLVTDVRLFQVSVTPEPVAEVEISAKVISDRGGKIVAARVFRASVPAASTEGPAAVAALDEACQRVITELVTWATSVV
jgi:cholesterol transport system auxiliary component